MRSFGQALRQPNGVITFQGRAITSEVQELAIALEEFLSTEEIYKDRAAVELVLKNLIDDIIEQFPHLLSVRK